MDYTPLVNSDKKTILNTKDNSSCIIYTLLCLLFCMQIVCLTYMIILGEIALDINLFNYNKTETNDYIDKFKHIIDSICATMIQC